METHELFTIQDGLKSHIGYQGPDKFEKMVLAMVVEFMEAANDWRGFKYWSKNQQRKETLLEEYVDGLHFVLEAGLDLLEMGHIQKVPAHVFADKFEVSITKQFKAVARLALLLDIAVEEKLHLISFRYNQLFEHYLALGQMLGFNEKQIHAAYLAKNQVNYARQDNGY